LVLISSLHADTAASPRGGAQGWTSHHAPHPSAREEDPRSEEITTEPNGTKHIQHLPNRLPDTAGYR
jgi:hypothetical protein